MDQSADEVRPPLKPLRVDLDELSIALEDASGNLKWYLDTATGGVVLVSEDEVVDLDISAEQIESDESGRFVPIPPADSRDGYDDMVRFIDTIADAHFRELLEVAIHGRGAFRRFKDVLGRRPDALQRWFEFRDRRLADRAREWLADEGFEALPKDAPK